MNVIKFSAYLCVSLICSMSFAAEWKNPDQQQPDGRQTTDRSQPAARPATRAPQATADQPVLLSGELGLEVNWVCEMEPAYNDKGTGGAQDVQFFQPLLPPGYGMLGGYAQGNHHGASGCLLAVRPVNDASNALLQPASTWRQIWTDENSGGTLDGSIWHAQAASPDYVCLGSIAKQGYSQPNLANYACVHQCLVEEIQVAGYIWSDAGTGASQDVSIYRLHNSNGFYAVSTHDAPRTLLDIRRNTVCNF